VYGAKLISGWWSQGQRSVPVLVEDDKVVQIGWQGRTCIVEDKGTN